MGTHPIFESDFDCLTDRKRTRKWPKVPPPAVLAMIRPISSPESPVDEPTISRRSETLDEADSTGPLRPRDELLPEPVEQSTLRMSTDDSTTDSERDRPPRKSPSKLQFS